MQLRLYYTIWDLNIAGSTNQHLTSSKVGKTFVIHLLHCIIAHLSTPVLETFNPLVHT